MTTDISYYSRPDIKLLLNSKKVSNILQTVESKGEKIQTFKTLC